jgi:hypothetical protein
MFSAQLVTNQLGKGYQVKVSEKFPKVVDGGGGKEGILR